MTYWADRAKALDEELYKVTDDVEALLDDLYRKSQAEMEKMISYYYAKFATENGISYIDAVKMLTKKEYQVFQDTLESYVERIEKLGDSETGQALTQELNALSINQRINRLTAMSVEISAIVGIKTLAEAKIVTNHLDDIYRTAYHRTLYDVAQQTAINGSFQRLNKWLVNEAINYPWSGEMFSDRIWNNKEKLTRTLREELTKGFIQGRDIRKTTSIFAERMDVSRQQAATLVQTESTAVISSARKKSYEQTEVVEKVEFVATLDTRTSRKCREADGKTIPLEEIKVGVNVPPLHPRCRSTYVNYIEDKTDMTRIGKDSNGKRIFVPADMKYEEFYEKYLTK